MHKVFLFFLAMLFTIHADAIETSSVLPIGIRNLSYKFGKYSGLNESYTNSGELKYLSDIKSLELDSATLTQIEPAVNDLITVLNQFGTYNLGDQLSLGRLDISANPDIEYNVPMFLYGVTRQLTLGVAIPIIHFKNSVNVTQIGSNLGAIKEEFHGVSTELDAAFAQLDKDMAEAFRDTLSEKGYKSLDPKNETFVGDVVLISAYQLPNPRTFTHAAQFHIGLPTGPEPDADDLADIETFHRWTAKPIWISTYKISKNVFLLGTTSYQYIVPQKVDKRVPLNADDKLPDKSQKIRVSEDLGDTWAVATGIGWSSDSPLSVTGAYSYEIKNKDTYSGVPDGRDRFLTADTDRQAQLVKLELEYSTISQYYKGQVPIPAKFSIEISQVIAGKNIENQNRIEGWLNVYF